LIHRNKLERREVIIGDHCEEVIYDCVCKLLGMGLHIKNDDGSQEFNKGE